MPSRSAIASGDQSAASPELDGLEEMLPFAPDGTLTPGNTSSLHDGAAFVVVVSEKVWRAHKKPPALKLVLAAALGVAPGEDGSAPIEAMRKLYSRLNGFKREDIGVFELSESSAAQEIALAELLDLDPAKINPDGGAIARGHPLGAAGAVLVVRTLDPSLAPMLPGLRGLVAETGSVLSHLAILARELGVPTVVGVEDAVRRFGPGTEVVVDGSTGEVSVVASPTRPSQEVAA